MDLSTGFIEVCKGLSETDKRGASGSNATERAGVRKLK